MGDLDPGFRKDRISLARVNLRVLCNCRVCVEFHAIARLLLCHLNAQCSGIGSLFSNEAQDGRTEHYLDAQRAQAPSIRRGEHVRSVSQACPRLGEGCHSIAIQGNAGLDRDCRLCQRAGTGEAQRPSIDTMS